MENTYTMQPIGHIEQEGERCFIQLLPQYAPGLTGLTGFSHLQLIWWFSELDFPAARQQIMVQQPYQTAPAQVGVFATRSPARPNCLALDAVQVLSLDIAAGRVEVDYLDAADGSPLLDIKPYSPCLDRLNSAQVPDWCSHWPQSREESAGFDWEQEFNF